MLHKIRDLQGDWIHAADGEVGSVDDLYFDSRPQVSRLADRDRPRAPARRGRHPRRAHARADQPLSHGPGDSRQWLPGKLLLISPEVIARIDWPEKKVHLRLAREDFLQAPEVPL